MRIRREGRAGAPPRPIISGQAPNNFQIPRGRYRIDVTKKNYQGQTRVVDVDIAETKPLFFKLDPIPARLEIETVPPGATLYVNGNRARNPYRQDVAPGHVEIFAEAPDHDGKHRRAHALARRAQAAARRRRAAPVLRATLGAPRAPRRLGRHRRLRRRGRRRGGDRQGPGESRTSRRCCSSPAAASRARSRARSSRRRSCRATSPTTARSSSWATCGSARAEGVVDGNHLAADRDAPSGRRASLPGSAPVPPAARRPAASRLHRQLAWPRARSDDGRAHGDRAPTYGRVALIQSAALGGRLTGALAQLALRWQPYGSGWELQSARRRRHRTSKTRWPDRTSAGRQDTARCQHGDRR